MFFSAPRGALGVAPGAQALPKPPFQSQLDGQESLKPPFHGQRDGQGLLKPPFQSHIDAQGPPKPPFQGQLDYDFPSQHGGNDNRPKLLQMLHAANTRQTDRSTKQVQNSFKGNQAPLQ